MFPQVINQHDGFNPDPRIRQPCCSHWVTHVPPHSVLSTEPPGKSTCWHDVTLLSSGDWGSGGSSDIKLFMSGGDLVRTLS